MEDVIVRVPQYEPVPTAEQPDVKAQWTDATFTGVRRNLCCWAVLGTAVSIASVSGSAPFLYKLIDRVLKDQILTDTAWNRRVIAWQAAYTGAVALGWLVHVCLWRRDRKVFTTAQAAGRNPYDGEFARHGARRITHVVLGVVGVAAFAAWMIDYQPVLKAWDAQELACRPNCPANVTTTIELLHDGDAAGIYSMVGSIAQLGLGLINAMRHYPL